MGATLVAAEALERGAELDLLTTVTGMILDLVKEIVSSQEPGPRVVRE